MSDPTAAARMKRYRQRLKEQAPARAEIRARRVAAVADRLERDHAAAARLLANVDPALGEALIQELNRRQFERAEARAVARAGGPDRGERPS